MSDTPKGQGTTQPVDTRGEPDRDIRFSWLYAIGGAVVVVTLLYAALSWPLSRGLVDLSLRRDPPASPLRPATGPTLPPGPRLQSDPAEEMEALRSREEAHLSSYGWIDRQGGVARIPLERAMEMIVEGGLPEVEDPRSPRGSNR